MNYSTLDYQAKDTHVEDIWHHKHTIIQEITLSTILTTFLLQVLSLCLCPVPYPNYIDCYNQLPKPA